jgi:hypothetical protein
MLFLKFESWAHLEAGGRGGLGADVSAQAPQQTLHQLQSHYKICREMMRQRISEVSVDIVRVADMR